jgi:hypothetical protein
MYPCILFYSAGSVLAISHPASVKQISQVSVVYRACAKIVPDDGEASKRGQQHGMQEVRRHVEGVGAETMWVRVFITKDGVYTKMNRRGERVKRYDGAVK